MAAEEVLALLGAIDTELDKHAGQDETLTLKGNTVQRRHDCLQAIP
jgi:hypothetical protein